MVPTPTVWALYWIGYFVTARTIKELHGAGAGFEYSPPQLTKLSLPGYYTYASIELGSK